MKKVLWGNAVNLSGLWSRTSMKLTWQKGLKEWYDSAGNFSVAKAGTQSDLDGDFIAYASHDKKDVDTWTAGVRATMKILHRWAK